MKKLIILLAILWAGLNAFANSVKADEYNKAVVANVITNTIQGNNVDVSKLMEQELQKLAHQFTIESLVILQKYLPTILEGVAAELRMKADKELKCELLKDSKIKDDC